MAAIVETGPALFSVSPTEQFGYLLLPGYFVNYSKQDK